MKTIVTESTDEAARIIRGGGLVAFPTETVYGLGADVFNEAAVAKVFAAKDRPADNPLIAHVGDPEQIKDLVAEIPESAAVLIEQFFPGPLTLVMPKADAVPHIATAGLGTIGVRMPAEPVTREFLRLCRSPVVAPSANVSGKPSPTDWNSVLEDLDGRIDCVLKGEPSRVGLESTVVDCTGDVPVVLRPGAISLEELRAIVPDTGEISGSTDLAARSPGTRHRHYSPKARVVLVGPAGAEASKRSDAAYIGLGEPPGEFSVTLKAGSVEEYARELFSFFRECDRRGVGVIYCETVPSEGLGAALMDRLRRASE